MKRLTLMIPVLLAIVLLPLYALAQHGADHQHGAAPPEQGAADNTGHGGHGMMGKCMQQAESRAQQAKVDLDAMDKRLNEKIATMNAAEGDQKVAAMSEVINELASQRKELHEKLAATNQTQMCAMMQQHMGKMGDHKDHGGMSGGCPMMKGHGAHQGSSDTGHTEGSSM
jgi:hypothetical protein